MSVSNVAETHPSRIAPVLAASATDLEIERVRQALRSAAAGVAAAARQALALAASYPLRRSRGVRRQALALCEEVAAEAPELAVPAHELAAWLLAEGDLLETSGPATLRACRRYIALMDAGESGGGERSRSPADAGVTSEGLAALARAGLSHALIQLAAHFPAELAELEIDVPEALERALALAEEAIARAPLLPDGHTALGRLLVCHDDPQAWADAVDVLTHALTLDPEHDPAQVALAVALYAQGHSSFARQHVEQVIRRGSGQAQPLLLRALMAMNAGQPEEARRDLERAVRIAPFAGLVQLEAANAADAAGDASAAETYRARAQELLGAATQAVRRALADAGDSRA